MRKQRTPSLARELFAAVFWNPRQPTLDQLANQAAEQSSNIRYETKKALVDQTLRTITGDVRSSLKNPNARLYEDREYTSEAGSVLAKILQDGTNPEEKLREQVGEYMKNLVMYSAMGQGDINNDKTRRDRFIDWAGRHKQLIRGAAAAAAATLVYFPIKWALGIEVSPSYHFYADTEVPVDNWLAVNHDHSFIREPARGITNTIDAWKYRDTAVKGLQLGTLLTSAVAAVGTYLARTDTPAQRIFDQERVRFKQQREILAEDMVKQNYPAQ